MSPNHIRSGTATPKANPEDASPDNEHHPPIKKNAFVHKLYSMLSDPNLKHVIWWNENNEQKNTFSLYPGKEFSKILTNFFKHGNVASFVRQLHMYGFHKISENNNDNQVWEFKHSSGKFRKDAEESLIYIKRRSSSNSGKNANNGPGHRNATSNPSLENHIDPASFPMYQHQIIYPYYVSPDWHMHQQHMAAAAAAGGPQPPVPMHLLPPQASMVHPHPLRLPLHHVPVHQANPGSVPQPFVQHHQQIPTPRENFDREVKRQKLASPIPQSRTPEVQQYNPLQFRKIWDNGTNQSARPRNPSLLFDPLAPAPLPPSRKFSAPSTNTVELPRSIPGTAYNALQTERIRPSLVELYNTKMNAHEPISASNSIFSNKSSISSISSLNRNSINDTIIANEPPNFKTLTSKTQHMQKVSINSLIDEETDS